MVGERGFEPPTPWSRTRCSTRLSHSPTDAEAPKNCRRPRRKLRNYQNETAKLTISDYNIACYDIAHELRMNVMGELLVILNQHSC
jgi:hypothetical protein